jgi:hypothetical protein
MRPQFRQVIAVISLDSLPGGVSLACRKNPELPQVLNQEHAR